MNDRHYSEAVDYLTEIADQAATQSGAGGAQPLGLSTILGNQGEYCTLTDECMPTCNL